MLRSLYLTLCFGLVLLCQKAGVVLAQIDGENLSMRKQLKIRKGKEGEAHRLEMNESEYGTYLGLRPVEKAKPERNAECMKRASDGKWACFPDVIYIGTSKSGTTSMAAHLAFNPMIQNVLSHAESTLRKSKEGHFWEREKTGRNKGLNMTDLDLWLNFTKTDILASQEGFDTLEGRPVMIEYSPNYFVLDHVPLMLKEHFKYRLKFVVSLRDPISRTISSWKFKAKEGLKLHGLYPDDFFNVTMMQGIDQANCIVGCYDKTKDMRKCSITTCRALYDKRWDGRNGKYSYYAHVVKSLYAYQFLMWFAYFPKVDFFIFTMEQYRANPIGVTEALLDFLGLPLYDPAGKMGFKDKETLLNVLSVIMNETPLAGKLEEQVSSEVISTLRSFFAKHDEKLKEVLGWEKGYYS